MPTIYHYTKGSKLNAIFASGEIMREGEAGSYALGIKPQWLWGVPPVVWFTSEAEMPFTATPRITNEFGATPYLQHQMSRSWGYRHWAHICQGVFRLSFDAEQIKAQRYRTGAIRSSLLSSGMLRHFEQAARLGRDDVKRWYHCDQRVSLRDLVGIETWKDRWVPYPLEDQKVA